MPDNSNLSYFHFGIFRPSKSPVLGPVASTTRSRGLPKHPKSSSFDIHGFRTHVVDSHTMNIPIIHLRSTIAASKDLVIKINYFLITFNYLLIPSFCRSLHRTAHCSRVIWTCLQAMWHLKRWDSVSSYRNGPESNRKTRFTVWLSLVNKNYPHWKVNEILSVSSGL